jgi:putative oxidoreductase
MMTKRDWILLTPLARFADLALLLLRLATGAFLIYQSHDNVISSERMFEFEKFLTHFGFVAPQLMAPLSVYAQFICAILFILGLLTRWAGLITAFNFIVAVWMVHLPQSFDLWWPALVLVFLGLLFATHGAGRYALDAVIARRRQDDRHQTQAAAA